jgi:type II secretory pathway pseudopilin PulG
MKTKVQANSSIVSHTRAFSMVEAVVSLLVVSTMLVAALSTVSASRIGQYKTSLASRGQLLAENLLAEIIAQRYKDPDGQPVFGPESGESTTTRINFDDVDDYHGWSSSPPTYKDGSQIPGFSGWRQNVAVEWVNATEPTQVWPSETGAKRITVTVFYNDMQVASLVAIRTNSGY